MNEDIYDNKLFKEFRELNKDDHDTPNNVMDSRYRQYYKENKHRIEENNIYKDCSKEELIDIILVSNLEKKKLLSIIKNIDNDIYQKIVMNGILSKE
jgi:hypothetical protein